MKIFNNKELTWNRIKKKSFDAKLVRNYLSNKNIFKGEKGETVNVSYYDFGTYKSIIFWSCHIDTKIPRKVFKSTTDFYIYVENTYLNKLDRKAKLEKLSKIK